MGKHLVDFILHPVAETVDGNEIRFLISGKPDIMDVTVAFSILDVTVKELFLDFAAAFWFRIPEKTLRVQALNQKRQPCAPDLKFSAISSSINFWGTFLFQVVSFN